MGGGGLATHIQQRYQISIHRYSDINLDLTCVVTDDREAINMRETGALLKREGWFSSAGRSGQSGAHNRGRFKM